MGIFIIIPINTIIVVSAILKSTLNRIFLYFSNTSLVVNDEQIRKKLVNYIKDNVTIYNEKHYIEQN